MEETESLIIEHCEEILEEQEEIKYLDLAGAILDGFGRVKHPAVVGKVGEVLSKLAYNELDDIEDQDLEEVAEKLDYIEDKDIFIYSDFTETNKI